MLDRTRPPAFSQTFHLDLKQAVTRYAGKVPIHFLSAGKQPVVKIEIILRNAGSYYDDISGTAYLTSQMLTHGTRSKNHHEIMDEFEFYGAHIKTSPSFDDPSVVLHCLKKNAASVLPLLAEILREPTFPADEFEHVREISLEQLHQQNARNNIIAAKTFRQELFGKNHPYGRIMDEIDLLNLTPQHLKDFFNSHFIRKDILVSGDVDEELLNMVANLFATEESLPREEAYNPPVTGRNVIYSEKDKSLQTSLRIGRLLPAKNHPDYIPLRICLHALGGYFGSRLMKNIREDKGFTYGIYASPVALKHTGFLSIGADVQKKFRTEAIKEIYGEIEALRSTPIHESELQTVRNNLLGTFQSDLNSPFDLAEKFKGVYLFGLDYSYYDEYIDTIQSVSAETIRDMAVKYLDPADLSEISVG